MLNPRWLTQNVRHRSLANFQIPYALTGNILNYAGWLTPVLHDGWLEVLFPETLSPW